MLPKEIIMAVAAKNIITNIGHDLGGCHADIYFKNKKVAYLSNDGWGGIPDVKPHDYSEKGKKLFKQFKEFIDNSSLGSYIAADYNQTPNFDITYTADSFSFEEKVQFMVERFIILKEIRRREDVGILYGNPLKNGEYSISKFSRSISYMKENYPEILKKELSKIKSSLKEGEEILNTNLFDYL